MTYLQLVEAVPAAEHEGEVLGLGPVAGSRLEVDILHRRLGKRLAGSQAPAVGS